MWQKKPTRARARKGEAQGVLSYQKATGIFDNPHISIYLYIYIWQDFFADEIHICWTRIFPGPNISIRHPEADDFSGGSRCEISMVKISFVRLIVPYSLGIFFVNDANFKKT